MDPLTTHPTPVPVCACTQLENSILMDLHNGSHRGLYCAVAPVSVQAELQRGLKQLESDREELARREAAVQVGHARLRPATHVCVCRQAIKWWVATSWGQSIPPWHSRPAQVPRIIFVTRDPSDEEGEEEGEEEGSGGGGGGQFVYRCILPPELTAATALRRLRFYNCLFSGFPEASGGLGRGWGSLLGFGGSASRHGNPRRPPTPCRLRANRAGAHWPGLAPGAGFQELPPV